jgi:uncharacterized protein (DUF58 family)
MTVPGRTLLFFCAVLALAMLGALARPAILFAVLAGDVLLLAAFTFDRRRLAKVLLEVSREEGSRFQLGRQAEFVYRLENRSDSPLLANIRQTWPESFESEERDAGVEIAPGEIVRIALAATPRQRGHVSLPPPELSISSAAGLAVRRQTCGDAKDISVYPDLQSLYDYDVLRRSRALRQMGIHRMRLIGAGREFEQLREYVPDDDYRNINWKSTARKREPITNVYQIERSQDVLIAIDCGRMMAAPAGRGSALDCAVDASVMLAHAADKNGDRIGLALFKDSVELFIKPKAGRAAVARVIEELVDAQAEGVFPSFFALAENLKQRQKRRSMIFLFTDLNDLQLANDISAALPLLSRRHVVVVISLRDPALAMLAEGAAESQADVYGVLAARDLVSERDARMRDISRHGIQVLEADSESLTMEVINRYLTIKMRQMV